MARGIVYCLTNSTMKGFVKIGRTGDSVQSLIKRINSLSNKTSVADKYKAYHALSVKDVNKAEKLLHEAFKDFRYKENKEFFEIHPERVKAAMELVLVHGNSTNKTARELERFIEHNTLPTNTDKNSAHQRSSTSTTRRPGFKFSDWGIPVGAELTFRRDSNIKATVINDQQIRYKREIFSPRQITLKLLRQYNDTRKHAAFPNHWKYNNELLNDIRTRKEQKPQTNNSRSRITEQKQRTSTTKKPPFNFSDWGIPVGAELVFYKTDPKDNSDIKAVVVNDEQMKYENKIWENGTITLKLIRDMFGKTWKGAAFANHWKYNNELLKDIRTRKEQSGKVPNYPKQKSNIRPHFKFSMANITKGAILNFSKDRAITATVKDDNTIEFEGSQMSLSRATDKILNERFNRKGHHSGTLYWEYKREMLDARRRRIEESK